MGATAQIQATTDRTQFYAEWEPRVRSLARYQGFAGADLDDVAQEILVFLTMGRSQSGRPYLENYDAQRGPFATYIYGLVRLRLADARRNYFRRGQHEFTAPEIFEADDSADSVDAEMNLDNIVDCMEVSAILTQVHDALKQFPASKTKDLARLFRDLIQQVIETGEVNYTEIARRYGYSRQAIAQQVTTLMGTEPMRQMEADLRARVRPL